MSKRPQTAGRTELGRGVPPARRPGAGQIIEGRKAKAVDRWLDRLDGNAIRDRRPIQLTAKTSRFWNWLRISSGMWATCCL